MTTPISSFRDLMVWQKSMRLAEQVYHVTESFPKNEMYGLTSQLRRAAVSIPSNIAEGYGRHGTGVYVHHINIALGSEAELQTQLELSFRLRIVGKNVIDPLIADAAELGRMLNGLAASLEASKKQQQRQTER